MSESDSERRLLSNKELAKAQRKAAYQEAKLRLAADPRHQAMKEAVKEQRRAVYQKVKESRKAAAAEQKSKQKAARTAERSERLKALLGEKLTGTLAKQLVSGVGSGHE